MKYLLVPFIALGAGTAAIAATPDAAAVSGSYPACSKTVKDECTQAAARPAKHVASLKHAHKAARHHHDRPVARSS